MVYTDLADFNAHRQQCIQEQRTDLLGQTEAQNNKIFADTSDISSVDSDDENKDFRNAEAKLAKNPQLTILKQALTKGDSLKRNFDDDGSTSSSKPKKIIKSGKIYLLKMNNKAKMLHIGLKSTNVDCIII